ncbi:keratin-associated protein 5-7-like isoform X1 [Acropora millepora]|uniref:keratin-associated protein 5-7-like isoform X1 n=1 Tax=Acropora millepora TaxID=45264 RepID=UPI001CF45EC6|nr:keratin-associated protein 5-7-like isoform X1 [Acropora millepora]XP_044182884.1 keratin-associated protein 5-7-like isoform X1 [Acropora millepora]XP_044182885.1 keratin-associated protein 5-7-like isoform X1 [Acropora millepora]
MATLRLLALAFLLALCIIPQDRVSSHGDGHSLECYVCGPDESPCGPANNDKRTCEAHTENRCATFVVNSVTRKNCTNSLECSPSSIGNPCVQMNMSAPNCSVSCCQTDLCNMAMSPGTGSTAQPTSGAPELTANFFAVIITFMLAKVLKPFCSCLSMF